MCMEIIMDFHKFVICLFLIIVQSNQFKIEMST